MRTDLNPNHAKGAECVKQHLGIGRVIAEICDNEGIGIVATISGRERAGTRAPMNPLRELLGLFNSAFAEGGARCAQARAWLSMQIYLWLHGCPHQGRCLTRSLKNPPALCLSTNADLGRGIERKASRGEHLICARPRHAPDCARTAAVPQTARFSVVATSKSRQDQAGGQAAATAMPPPVI
jgi:hypothetical protein